MGEKSTVEWQMQRFGLTREEAEEKLKAAKEKRALANKLKLDPEWQMQRFGLTREEAEEKIRLLRISYGSAHPKSVEWQMQRFGLTREEAEEKIADISKRTSENVSKARLEHPETNESRKEYWIAKGYNEEEAEKIVSEKMQKMRNAYKKCIEENPEKYTSSYNTRIEYYLNKGMTQEEAEIALKERQTTNSLEKYIKKYGDEVGRKLYEERQIKWSAKVEAKYQAGEFSKQPKKFNSSCFSKVEKSFIEELEKSFNDFENAKTYKNGQKIFRDETGKVYFCDVCYKNKIIEFNGDYWHCNPKIYEANYFHKIKNMNAKDIWEHDDKKIKFLKSKGYEILVIWENDFATNKETTINKAIQFLND